MEFKWSFTKIKGVNLTGPMRDKIVEIGWQLRYEDKSVFGTVNLPEPQPENFKAYPALTSDDFQSWIEGVLGSQEVERIKSELKGRTYA
jgi:hypothetical protein